eukprot:scaffold88721_cov23-Cyclotella_meneghiniana.AAC.3
MDKYGGGVCTRMGTILIVGCATDQLVLLLFGAAWKTADLSWSRRAKLIGHRAGGEILGVPLSQTPKK